MTAAATPVTGDLFARVACGIDGSEASIGTVRQVGYKFVLPPSGRQLPDSVPVSLPVG